MLIILSGVSGTGKNTVIREVLKRKNEATIMKSVTTRPRRESDDCYIYMTEEEFLLRRDNGEFFETEEVHGKYYGVLKASLENVINNPNIIYMKDIDVHGTERIVSFLKDKADVLTIFLDAPNEVLFDRLIKRGESEERAKIRLQRGEMEREYKNSYDYVIENLNLETTVKFIEEKIDEKLK